MSSINNTKKHSSQCTPFLLSKGDAFQVFFLINSKKKKKIFYHMLCGCYETLWELPEKTQPVSSDLYLTQPYYLDKRRSLTYKLHISANMCIFSKDFA